MVGFAGDAIAIIDGRDNQIRDVQVYNNGVGVYIAGYLAQDNLVRRGDDLREGLDIRIEAESVFVSRLIRDD